MTNDKEQIYPYNTKLCKTESNLIINDSNSISLDSLQSIVYQNEYYWSIGAISGGTLGFVAGALLGYPIGKIICEDNGINENANNAVSACGFVPIGGFAGVGLFAGSYYGGKILGMHTKEIKSVQNCKI